MSAHYCEKHRRLIKDRCDMCSLETEITALRAQLAERDRQLDAARGVISRCAEKLRFAGELERQDRLRFVMHAIEGQLEAALAPPSAPAGKGE